MQMQQQLYAALFASVLGAQQVDDASAAVLNTLTRDGGRWNADVVWLAESARHSMGEIWFKLTRERERLFRFAELRELLISFGVFVFLCLVIRGGIYLSIYLFI